jgi:thiamine biosynthesis protein ThiS
MKVKINYQEREFPSGTTLAQVADRVRASQQDDPVVQSLVAKTGKDHLIFSLNGRVVPPEKWSSIELQEGDDVRWFHPYAGG